MTHPQLVPAILAPLLVWRFYRRFRRNLGRQPFHSGRALTVVILFTAILGAFGLFAAAHPPMLSSMLGGVAAGGLLGLLGLKLTKFKHIDHKPFYIPNTYLGVGVSLLLVARIAYQFAFIASAQNFDQPPTPTAGRSPLTMALFGFTAGYYLVYNLGLLLKFRQQPVDTPEAVSPVESGNI